LTWIENHHIHIVHGRHYVTYEDELLSFVLIRTFTVCYQNECVISS